MKCFKESTVTPAWYRWPSSAGALLTGVIINQVIAWDATWDAWVAAQALPGGVKDALDMLPGGLVLAQILVVLALGMPRAIEINR